MSRFVNQKPANWLDPVHRQAPVTLEHQCQRCLGYKFWFWWETRERRIWQCADPDCLVVWEEKKREVVEL